MKVVIVEDNLLLNESLCYLLDLHSYSVEHFSNIGDAQKYLRNTSDKALVLSDMCLPDGSGYQLLEEFTAFPFILMTAFGEIEEAIAALKKGAKDFILKPFSNEEILSRIAKVLQAEQVDLYSEQLKKEICHSFTGSSESISKVIQTAVFAIDSDSTVLLTGESGTGKNLLASLIHQFGKRKNSPFVQVNCSALPRNLIESELFGHEAGSFTGANRTKQGKLEFADKGTLLLDEIGDIPPDLQVLLLRFLQEKTFERVGSNQSMHSDTRIMAATNQDLVQAVSKGDFREDLFYRLNIIHIHIPPLRHRTSDILDILQAINQRLAVKYQTQPKVFPKEVLAMVQKFPWYGNVRELENLMERIFVVNANPEVALSVVIEVGNFGQMNREQTRPQKVFAPQPGEMRTELESVEIKYIRWALAKANGNKSQAAHLLGVSRTALIHKIEKFQLD